MLDFVAVDWGAERLRIWLVDPQGQVLDRREVARGADGASPAEVEATLLAQLSQDLPEGQTTPVLCCGQVGEPVVWQSVPYTPVPMAPAKAQVMRMVTEDTRMAVGVLPGVQQKKPADVMHGAETQVAGFIDQNTDFDGVLCLVGAQTRWVRISAEEIVSFQTFMTGEMMRLLMAGPSLSGLAQADVWDESAFLDSVSDGMSRPQAVMSKLYGLHAEGLISKDAAGQGKARLMGLLIGSELAGARAYWLGMEVALVGSPDLTPLYQAALKAQGVIAAPLDGDAMTLAGLRAARAQLG